MPLRLTGAVFAVLCLIATPAAQALSPEAAAVKPLALAYLHAHGALSPAGWLHPSETGARWELNSWLRELTTEGSLCYRFGVPASYYLPPCEPVK